MAEIILATKEVLNSETLSQEFFILFERKYPNLIPAVTPLLALFRKDTQLKSIVLW